jgi:hypothetical protein
MGHFDGFPDPWDWPYPIHDSPEWLADHPALRPYFAYVEDVTDFDGQREIDAPSGKPLQALHPALKEAPTRFRMSGIALRDFRRLVDRFEPMDGPGEDAAKRGRRREQLTGLFEKAPIPVLDLFVPRHDEELRLARATLVPTSWHILVLVRGPGSPEVWPVYREEDDPRFGEPFGPAWLRSVLAVLPSEELRLRDIFSLNHIGDTGIEETGGGGGRPGPGWPPAKDDFEAWDAFGEDAIGMEGA